MDIRAFRGWRYVGDGGDVSALIAPPYDVLSAEDKRQLLDRSERNIVAVDLPHVPPKEAGPDEVYRQAARRLVEWQDAGVLRRDDAPCLYVYEQTYQAAGRTHTRRAMLCGVRATELGEDVMPHEHTFAGPKADRLKLTEQTRTQLSPIFGFYTDPGGVAETLAEASARQPDLRGTLDGVDQALWAVSDPDAIERVASALAGSKVYIADGHHRYTTAMNYARGLREAGQVGLEDEANFVLFAMVEEADEGLLVLPTHRVVSGLSEPPAPEALAESLGGAFDIRRTPIDPADLGDIDAWLGAQGASGTTLAIALAGCEELLIATLRDGEAMRSAAPDECEAWRELDVAVLHTLVLDGALGCWRTNETSIAYTPDAARAVADVRSGGAQVACLLRGTPLRQVRAVADAGASMPHKSTYFYPKLATGMVLKPL